MAVIFLHLLHTLMLTVIIICLAMDTSNGKPVKRSTTDDCQGTECYVREQYVFDDTRLLRDINSSISELGDIPSILSNMAQMQQGIMQLQHGMAQMLQSFLNHSNNLQQATLQELSDMKNLIKNQLEHQRMRELVLNYSVQLQQDTLQEPSNMTNLINYQKLPRHCSDVPSSGPYEIAPSIPLGPSSATPLSFPVFCDIDTNPGGWLLFQRRFDGSISFDRNWVDYENGFGSLDGEFWLGLSKRHVLTSSNQWQFRADLFDFEDNHAYAVYDNFQIGDSSSFYRLTLGEYTQGSNAGDAMRGSHDLNGMAFTTKDADHDIRSGGRNCGVTYRSGWWHRDCSNANPNGLYLGQGGSSIRTIYWYDWKSIHALKKTELKIRAVN